MLCNPISRRRLTLALLTTPVVGGLAKARAYEVAITKFGASIDASINTASIQRTIDHVAAEGGGVVLVPRGTFISGALFFKPRVNLHLAEGAVLQCSTEMKNFPLQRTRIEGHFEERFTPGLINADCCDGFTISGTGTLDGAGRVIWDHFWKLHAAAADKLNFPNLSVERARLAVIQNSRHVTVEGVTFKDSQFWNLHLYRCRDALVRNARFVVPDDYVQAPSTDGIDVDSCQDVTVDGCYFSVTDDCIAAKGTKGPGALEDTESQPVAGVIVRNCEFKRGHHAFACGSEATTVRNVVIENCRITGRMVVLRLKLRTDTPQRYEDIHLRNIFLDHAGGQVLHVGPWRQYAALDDHAAPQSSVRDVSISGLRGRYGSLGSVSPNPGQTTIQDIRFKDVQLLLAKPGRVVGSGANSVSYDDVSIDGKPL